MLIYLLAFDFSLGGGGQIFSYDGLSARYFIVGMATIIGLWDFLCNKKLNIRYIYSILFVLIFIIIGIIMGLINNYPLPLIFEVSSKYFLWVILPYLIFNINKENLKNINNIFIYSGLTLACAYNLLQILYFSNILNPALFFDKFNQSSEIFFRGQIYFFYKGFIYFVVSGYLIINAKKRFIDIQILLITTAVALISVRGFLVFYIVILICLLYISGYRYKSFFYIAIGFIAVIVSFYYIPNSIEGFSQIRDSSDEYRFNDIKIIIENTDFIKLIFGNGFGSEVNGRIYTENSYIDIFTKTGVFGLFCYLSAIFIIIFFKFPDNFKTNKNIFSYYAIILFLLFESLSNPFINNSIGIFLIMYFSVCLNIIRSQK